MNDSLSESAIFQTGEVSIIKRKSNEILETSSPCPKRFKLMNSDNSTNKILTDDKNTNNEETKIIVENNGNSSKSVERISSPTPGCSWFPEVEKPKLIIKEKKALYDDAFDLFSTFIETCLKRDPSNDMREIVKKLKKRHERLNPSFSNSELFKQLLIDKQKLIDINDEKLYSHISEVNDVMKEGVKNNTNNTIKQEKIKISNEIVKNEENSHERKRIRSKVRVILSRIELCKKRIKELEEKDVDFSDDSGSTYLIEDRYKRKLMKLWTAYCKYTGEIVDAGRAYLRPKHISTTMIPQVDQAIMNFINSKISRRNELLKKGKSIADTIIFPDYLDILNCISQCNDKNNLKLSRSEQEIKAKEAFEKIGEHLQRVRQRDYWDTFSLFLEEEDDDPALKDASLSEKLIQNQEIGKKNMDNLFEEFTKKQNNKVTEQNSENETIVSNEDDENDKENEDDDDDDDNDSDDKNDDDLTEDKEGNNEDTEKEDSDRDENKFIIEKENHEISSNENNKNLSIDAINDSLPQNDSSEAKDSTDADVIDIDDDNADKQPLLRLRSFAKPPTSWKDSQGSSGDSSMQLKKHHTSPTPVIRKFVTSTPKISSSSSVTKLSPTLVDLTSEKKDESPLKTSTVTKKFKTVMLPPNFKGKQIISVKNITNNYNVVNGPGNELPARVLTSVRMRVNQVPDKIMPVQVLPKSIVGKQLVANKQIVGNKQIIYQSNGNQKILNPLGKIVRVKSVMPTNNDMKVIKMINETQKVSTTTSSTTTPVVQKQRVAQTNSNEQIKFPRYDHQYSKKIVNNIVRIIKPNEQNLHQIDPNKVVRKT
ncbi:protein PFC0760c-like isoform X2 [Leptopilina boulardi]|nr:protein PFC0760c-like isoform X2 [Leptopilina boulardi]